MIQSFKTLAPLVAVAVLMTSCGGAQQATTADSTAAELPKVRIQQVVSRSVDQTYDFTATVEANVVNNIAPAQGTRIEKIYVEVGDLVSAGQKLAQMDRTAMLQAKTQLENLRVEFNRVDELYKVGGASKSEWDARKTALEVATAAYENLVTNTQLTSPVSGVVTARNYDSGDMYSAGKPVVVVEQIQPVKLVVNLSETLFSQVKKGMKVRVTIDVYGDEVFNGQVSLIAPTIDPKTRTFAIEITLPNGDRRVRPGMFARATMSFGAKELVVAPDRAVVKQVGSGDYYIYVYDQGKVSYNKVTVGRRLGTEYEILGGIASGAQVVTSGQSRLRNGSQVEIDASAADSLDYRN